MTLETLQYVDFPHQTYEKIRFADTDMLGHVNNSVFSRCFDSGHSELTLTQAGLLDEGCIHVMAKIKINFISEIKWPGTVEIGTLVTRIGNSSLAVYQCLYQNGQRVGDAHTTLVQINKVTRKAQPLSNDVKILMEKYVKLF